MFSQNIAGLLVLLLLALTGARPISSNEGGTVLLVKHEMDEAVSPIPTPQPTIVGRGEQTTAGRSLLSGTAPR